MNVPRSCKEQIIAEHVVTAEEAARRLGSPTEDAAAWASSKRKRDELFGVWSQTDQAFIHPDFQFGGNATPSQLRELLTVLRTRVGFEPLNADKGGWARAYWLYQPDAQLSQRVLAAADIDMRDPVAATAILNIISDTPRTPAEVFLERPEAVIALAKELATQLST